MIERKGEGAYPFVLHEGNDFLTIQSHFLAESELPVMVQTWEFPVGGGEGVHSHPRSGENLEELYFVISGTASLTVNGESQLLFPGDSALTRPDDDRGVENAGDVPLTVLVIWGHPASARPDFMEFKTVQSAHECRASQAS